VNHQKKFLVFLWVFKKYGEKNLLQRIVEKEVIVLVRKTLRTLKKDGSAAKKHTHKSDDSSSEQMPANQRKSSGDDLNSQKLLLLVLYSTFVLQSHELTLTVLKFLAGNWEMVQDLKFGQIDKKDPFIPLLKMLTPGCPEIDDLFKAQNIQRQKYIGLRGIQEKTLNIANLSPD